MSPGALLQAHFGPTWEGAAQFQVRVEPPPNKELSIFSVAGQLAHCGNSGKTMFDGKNHP